MPFFGRAYPSKKDGKSIQFESHSFDEDYLIACCQFRECYGRLPTSFLIRYKLSNEINLYTSHFVVQLVGSIQNRQSTEARIKKQF